MLTKINYFFRGYLNKQIQLETVCALKDREIPRGVYDDEEEEEEEDIGEDKTMASVPEICSDDFFQQMEANLSTGLMQEGFIPRTTVVFELVDSCERP